MSSEEEIDDIQEFYEENTIIDTNEDINLFQNNYENNKKNYKSSKYLNKYEKTKVLSERFNN